MSDHSTRKLLGLAVTELSDRIDAELVARYAARGTVAQAIYRTRVEANAVGAFNEGRAHIIPDRCSLKAACRQFGELLARPEAGRLAAAWIGGADLRKEDSYLEDSSTIEIVVGVAAAVVVLVVIWAVRRGRRVTVPGVKEVAPSGDFIVLKDIAQGQGDAADLATALVDDIPEPWRWSLEAHVVNSDADQHWLLDAFVDHAQGRVERLTARAGDLHAPDWMSARVDISGDNVWVVSSDTPQEAAGYRRGDRTLVRLEVELCTADWWVLGAEGCPVGRVIKQHTDQLMPGGAEACARWRAHWGLEYPEDLRELCDEDMLARWSERMVRDLNPYYRDAPERHLARTGDLGDLFESSTMETDSEVAGDAVVTEVVARDGVPQHGLACPGGGALLLAVVRTEPKDE